MLAIVDRSHLSHVSGVTSAAENLGHLGTLHRNILHDEERECLRFDSNGPPHNERYGLTMVFLGVFGWVAIKSPISRSDFKASY